jgi:sigma-B regulation protein RsbU (phosphoserine phosphatase)
MKVTCASAGHPSPVLLRSGQAPTLPFLSTGLPAGIIPQTEIPSESLDLKAGDTLVFYTDGVTEAFDAHGAQFGERRLIEQLAKAPSQSALDTVTNTLTAVRTHAGEQPQSDDITILAVRCVP